MSVMDEENWLEFDRKWRSILSTKIKYDPNSFPMSREVGLVEIIKMLSDERSANKRLRDAAKDLFAGDDMILLKLLQINPAHDPGSHLEVVLNSNKLQALLEAIKEL